MLELPTKKFNTPLGFEQRTVVEDVLVVVVDLVLELDVVDEPVLEEELVLVLVVLVFDELLVDELVDDVLDVLVVELVDEVLDVVVVVEEVVLQVVDENVFVEVELLELVDDDVVVVVEVVEVVDEDVDVRVEELVEVLEVVDEAVVEVAVEVEVVVVATPGAVKQPEMQQGSYRKNKSRDVHLSSALRQWGKQFFEIRSYLHSSHSWVKLHKILHASTRSSSVAPATGIPAGGSGIATCDTQSLLKPAKLSGRPSGAVQDGSPGVVRQPP